MKHFLERTYLAILDFHQFAASAEQGAVKTGNSGQDQLLRIESFSPKRRKLFDNDVLTALQLLKSRGVKLGN